MGKLGLQWIDNVETEVHRLWTVRIGLFAFVLTGALVALPHLADELNPRLLLALCCAGYGLLGFLRLVKQAPAADV